VAPSRWRATHHWGRHGNNHKSWCKQCLSASQSGPGRRTAADRRHRGGRDHSTSQGRPDTTATTDGWVWVRSTGLAHLTGCGHLRRLGRRAARTGGRLDTFSLPLPANTDWSCLPTCMVCTKRQPGPRLPSGRARPGPLPPLRRTYARRRSSQSVSTITKPRMIASLRVPPRRRTGVSPVAVPHDKPIQTALLGQDLRGLVVHLLEQHRARCDSARHSPCGGRLRGCERRYSS
jgi:hypothetical protein